MPYTKRRKPRKQTRKQTCKQTCKQTNKAGCCWSFYKLKAFYEGQDFFDDFNYMVRRIGGNLTDQQIYTALKRHNGNYSRAFDELTDGRYVPGPHHTEEATGPLNDYMERTAPDLRLRHNNAPPAAKHRRTRRSTRRRRRQRR
tara:strand:+ start:48 stop:476 length:429 start_codon:yes stop_codon:yes gene_type:complete